MPQSPTRTVSGFEDDDESSDEEMVVTIGDIKKNMPFQKQAPGQVGKVDIDGQPEHEGKIIYDQDLASMEDKPWQKPGADMTDYFNYGFTEDTWNQYCERQKKLRLEYGSQREINRAIMGSIHINGQQVQVNPQGGRHLVNLAGPEKPQKASKMVYDLSRLPSEVSSVLPFR